MSDIGTSPSDPGVPGIVGIAALGRTVAATTYRATDAASGRAVIVKVLNRDATPEVRARFEYDQERISELIDHPDIVAVFRYGYTDDGHPYVVSDEVVGGSMADKVGSGLDGPGVVSLGVRLAGGLESAHRLQVVHGDLRPDDIMINHEGEPMIADFGIVTVTGYGPAQSDNPKRLAHAAPEQLDAQPPAAATDIYALGSVLYALLAGGPAFLHPGDTSVIPVIKRIASAPVPNLRDKGVPDQIADVIERAMNKLPDDRWRTAEEFGRAMQQAQIALGLPITEMTVIGPPRSSSEPEAPAMPPAQEVQPLAGAPGGAPSGAKAGGGRGPLVAIGAVVAVVLLAIVGFVAFAGGDDDGAERRGIERNDDDDENGDGDEDDGDGDDENGGDDELVFIDAADDLGLITLSVPEVWSDLNGVPLENGFNSGEQVPDIVAATDTGGFLSGLDASGVRVTALDAAAVNAANAGVDVTDPATLLDVRSSSTAQLQGNSIQSECATIGTPQARTAGAFEGQTQLFEGCGAGDVLLFGGSDGAVSIIVEFHLIVAEDEEAFDAVLDSIVVNGVP
ncbi:MAG: serine/threonine protein kinase [Acidimicrobiales bacterium]